MTFSRQGVGSDERREMERTLSLCSIVSQGDVPGSIWGAHCVTLFYCEILFLHHPGSQEHAAEEFNLSLVTFCILTQKGFFNVDMSSLPLFPRANSLSRIQVASLVEDDFLVFIQRSLFLTGVSGGALILQFTFISSLRSRSYDRIFFPVFLSLL